MNSIVITGYVTKDAELRYTSNKTAVTNFTVAVKREFSKDDKTDFINCFTLGKEKLTQYILKGTLICVRGSLQIDKYTDKEGKNKTVAKVKADDIQLLDKPKKADPQTPPPNFETVFNDDEIPF